MVSKFLGLDTLMEQIVRRMGEVEKAYIIGDYARGIDSGTVEMVLIGQNLDLDYLEFIKNKTFEKTHRKVKVQLFDEDPGDVAGFLIYGT